MVKSVEDMSLDELTSTVSAYPWYAGARKRLCEIMADLGDGAWSCERFAHEALYMGSRKLIAELYEKSRALKGSEQTVKEVMQQSTKHDIYVVGGDYFSKQQYEEVHRGEDNVFSSFAKTPDEGTRPSEVELPEDDFSDVCTETLAEIYAEQGYYDKAKEIYSMLSLRYPEKNTYFATLIEKIDKKDTK